MSSEFDRAVFQTADRIYRVLSFVPQEIKQNSDEIRLRLNLPLCLTVKGKVYFVCQDGSVTDFQSVNSFIVTKQDLQSTVAKLCNNSVYMHENEIKQGFISLPFGNRAGICGVFNDGGSLVTVTSLNIRIARQIFDCGKSLLPYSENGLLIAGPPSSGKTTILRDIIRLISNGSGGQYKRVAVIDSRGEISGGISKLDLGVNTDVLYLKDKAIGTQIALRTMFPNIIAFDEIGTNEELAGVCECFNAGVGIITTAHCDNANNLLERSIIKNIINCGAINYVAVMSAKIGEEPKIINVKELVENVGV